MEKSETEKKYPCPVCQADVAPTGAHAPFCSARCREIDLGRWASGKYAISRDATDEDHAEAASGRLPIADSEE